MSSPLLITGMHRSGTSLIASLVHHGGFSMGETLLGPGKANPHGFFEELDFVRFHDQALHDRGLTIFARGNASLEATEEEKVRARALVEARRPRERWGWKDPRSALFLGLWRELCPDARVLAVFRHPLDVLLSLVRRSDLYTTGLLEGLDAWHEYNRRILEDRRRFPERSALVHAYSVVDQFDRARALLEERLGISLQLEPGTLETLYKPSDLRRTEFPAEIEEILSLVHPEAMALYAELRRTADLSPASSAPLPTSDPKLRTLAQSVRAEPALQTRPGSRAALLSLCAFHAPELTENLFRDHLDQLAELERANAWLEEQQSNWKGEAGRLQAILEETRTWSQQSVEALQRAQSELQERRLWSAELERRRDALEARVAELEGWNRELEEAKRWLERHAASWEGNARRQEESLEQERDRLQRLERTLPVRALARLGLIPR